MLHTMYVCLSGTLLIYEMCQMCHPYFFKIIFQHLLDESLYLECIDPIEMDLEDDIPLPASGVSVEASHSSAGRGVPKHQSPSSYICDTCSKILKTKHGFEKHVMTHRINRKFCS